MTKVTSLAIAVCPTTFIGTEDIVVNTCIDMRASRTVHSSLCNLLSTPNQISHHNTASTVQEIVLLVILSMWSSSSSS